MHCTCTLIYSIFYDSRVIFRRGAPYLPNFVLYRLSSIKRYMNPTTTHNAQSTLLASTGVFNMTNTKVSGVENHSTGAENGRNTPSQRVSGSYVPRKSLEAPNAASTKTPETSRTSLKVGMVVMVISEHLGMQLTKNVLRKSSILTPFQQGQISFN